LTANVFGQNYQFPNFINEGSSARQFAPKGWFVSDSVTGDLNKDSLLDIAFILKKKDKVVVKGNDGDEYEMLSEVLAVALKGKGGKYLLTETNKKILIDNNYPPTSVPSFSSMRIANGVFNIEFSFDYINGNFYFYTYKFRFQRGQFQLIGAESTYTTRRNMNFKKASYNFSTKRWSLTIGTYSNQDPPKLSEKTEWFDFKFEKLKTLKTMGRPGTWEITKDMWL
jgi:hypothetical protein